MHTSLYYTHTHTHSLSLLLQQHTLEEALNAIKVNIRSDFEFIVFGKISSPPRKEETLVVELGKSEDLFGLWIHRYGWNIVKLKRNQGRYNPKARLSDPIHLVENLPGSNIGLLQYVGFAR